eukprot:gnl/MRDRNA2_/MRDRNA2_22696_c0_seq1.p1 gnl/MRDRNA2_/MRDRNA2_22696_c0~~gnl/MRDRNA2_/MRDRNA2_22696_c0_seq1.p1  ORF type:complete len:338 (+),score=37.30 gnl/MRDRNA2_/MRDRNA2_22696_c0_seq1:86-1099(+)
MVTINDEASVHDLHARLSRANPPCYRFLNGIEVPALESPACSMRSLSRFLTARKGDMPAAELMLLEHLHWRRRVFPIEITDSVKRIIDGVQDSWGIHFQFVGLDSEGDRIFMINHRWGNFDAPEFPIIDILRAGLVYWEEQFEAVEASGRQKICCISFGGPPPIDFAMALLNILEQNYPERLKRAVLYPIPPLLKPLVGTCLLLVNTVTRDKIRVISEEHELVLAAKMETEQMPSIIRGGYDVIMKRFNPDMKKHDAIIWETLTTRGAGAKPLLQTLEQAGESTTVDVLVKQRLTSQSRRGRFWWLCRMPSSIFVAMMAIGFALMARTLSGRKFIFA